MKASTLRMVLLWLTSLILCVSPLGGSDNCCRSLAEQIWYVHQTFDAIPIYQAEVLKVSREGGKTALFIHTSRATPVRTFSGSDYRVVRSLDLGKTLQPIQQEVPTPLGTNRSFLEAPSNPKFLYRYVHEFGLYVRSENGGLSWILPKYLIAGKPRDRFAYQVAGTDLDTVRFEIVAIHPVNPLTIFARLTVAPWTAIALYDPDFINPDEGVAKALEDFMRSKQGAPNALDGTYISRDGGDSWEKYAAEMRLGEPMGISPSRPSVMYGHGLRGVVKSVDGGMTWQPVGQQHELELRPLTEADKNEEARMLKGLVHLHIRQILIDPTTENTVYLVSNKGLIRSTDGGSTWCLLNLGFDEIESVNSVALDPMLPTGIFVGTTRGIFYSSDSGCHFQRIYPYALDDKPKM